MIKFLMIVLLAGSIFLYLSMPVSAQTKYFFGGDYFEKVERYHGGDISEKRCENKIDVERLGIAKYTVGNNYDDIYVSPDEKYFVFHGSSGRQSRWQFFLVDAQSCKVVRELTPGKEYNPFDFSAGFSPDSKKLYISWHVLAAAKSIDDKGFWLTTEYSGANFENEKKLLTIRLPKRRYKFSHDAKFIVVSSNPVEVKTSNARGVVFAGLSVFDVQKDVEVFNMKSRADYFDKKKNVKYALLPDIADGLLLFNFESHDGTEIDIFDYKNKKVINKIDIPHKGTGMFVSDGSRIIFSTLPDPKAWQKDVVVIDINTGKQLGKTALDEEDEVTDVSPDGKQVIYKRGNIEKKAEIK